MKGLADIQLMGLPNQVLKESLIRVKSAIKNQGFHLPKAHKVLINLKPADQKKGGRGLELAIAMAILMETGQIPKEDTEKLYAYGQLGLKGEVNYLDEVSWLPLEPNERVWSGTPSVAIDRPIRAIKELWELSGECEFIDAGEPEDLPRPELTKLKFDQQQAKLMAILAQGGHHSLVAGPAGSGKSTLAYALHTLLPEPSISESREIRKWNQYFNRSENSWRPLQAPHHTATPQAILGGGNPPEPGEITRAHGGLLLLDEFLEFPVRIREGLREPIERGEVQISRRGFSETLPAKFQLIATTNLCPCGDFVPKKIQPICRFSKSKCQSYLERLTGPLADRFDILAFSNDWKAQADVQAAEILSQINSAQSFMKLREQEKPNARLDWGELMKHLEKPTHIAYLPEGGRSRRRHISILRVARTLADLDQSEKIKITHIREAMELSWRPFENLKESFF
jgi:magnesium chelatase family protein